MRKQVRKQLTPEELSMVSNIESIIQELKQMRGGDEEYQEEDLMVMEQEDMPGEEDEKDVEKGIETTESEGVTAVDDTEERIDENLPEQTGENVDEVEKAVSVILGHINKKNVATKSEKSPLVEVLNKIVDVQKASQSQLNELSTAFSHVLDGMGVLDQLDVVKKEKQVKKINKSQNEELLNALAQLTGKVEKTEGTQRTQISQVRKDLASREVLAGLVGK